MAGETDLTVNRIGKDRKIEDVSFETADQANNNKFVNTGKELVFVKNGHVSSLDVVVECQGCTHNLVADDTISTAAGEESVGGPYDPGVWNDANGEVILTIADDGSDTLELLVVKFD